MLWVMDMICHKTSQKCKVVPLNISSLPATPDDAIPLLKCSRVFDDMEGWVILVAVNCGRSH